MRKQLYAIIVLAIAFVPQLGFAQQPAPSVNISLGDITDNRTNGQFFAGLKVDFKLSGDTVYDAYGIGKPVFSVAKDDTGRSIIKEDKDSTLMWDLKTRQQKSNNEMVTGDLANPARKAATVTLQGVIPVYAPALDPAAVVTIADITTTYGKPMISKQPEISVTVLDKASSEAFAKAKEEEKKAQAAAGNPLNMALGQMFGFGGSLQSNDLQFRVKDPNQILVRLEVIGLDGKVIESNGRSKMSSDGEDVYTNSYNQPLPKGAGLRIYYATPKSLLNVPFDYQSVALP